MAKNQEQLKAEAGELGIELSGEEKNVEIAEAIKIKKEENRGDDLQREASELEIALSGDEENDDIAELIKEKKEEIEEKQKSAGGIYYHVKVKAFYSDEDRADIGLYRTDKEIKRFEKLSNDFVERVSDDNGEVALITLHKIAEKFKVSIFEEGGKTARDEEEILEELVKEL